jgi:AcrR family transcriptional regulator
MQAELGLRERKKQRTRQLIAETARQLFAERGFDAVPVADVARGAEVSEATVFNYFPTKEDLVFQGMEAFEDELLQAVRNRPAGESAAAAFGRFVTQPRGFLAAQDEETARRLVSIARMIAESPALQAREREIFARYTASLAAVLADETGCTPLDVTPRVVAAALVGLHAGLIGYVRLRLAGGPADHAQLARDVQAEGRRALQVLEEGLAGYAPKQWWGPARSDRASGSRQPTRSRRRASGAERE